MSIPAFITPAFLTAAVANFLFFTNLSAFFLLPLHLKQLGATESHIGLVMGLYSGTAIVCQPVVGAWVDRAGRRPFMVIGAGLAMLACLCYAAAPAAVGLFPVFRILQGLGYSLYFIANFTLVVDLVPPERRGQALGVFGISGLTSTAVGPALGEVVVRAFGFRAFFLATAAVAGASLVVSSRVSEPPRQTPAGGSEGLAGLVRGVLGAPRLPMSLAFAFGLGLGVVFTFFPTYAASLGAGRVGLFAVAYSMAALTVRAAGGPWMDRVRRRQIIVPALVLQALSAALLAGLAPLTRSAGVPALPVLFLVGLLAGAAHGFLYPALSALVMDVTPEGQRGRVIGVFSAFILSGQAIGAVVFGSVAHAVGYPLMFGLLAVLLGGACVLGLRLDR
jgi:MFS family permease